MLFETFINHYNLLMYVYCMLCILYCTLYIYMWKWVYIATSYITHDDPLSAQNLHFTRLYRISSTHPKCILFYTKIYMKRKCIHCWKIYFKNKLNSAAPTASNWIFFLVYINRMFYIFFIIFLTVSCIDILILKRGSVPLRY